MTMRRLALFVLFFTFAIEAQAPPSFREGVLAFEKKEWANAEKLMRATIAVNPNETEGTVSIAGSWFETYVPHYFLARALAKQGKCDEALREFAESERQGVTPTIPDFARHLQTRGGCKPQTKAAKPKEIVFETTVPFGESSVAPVPAPAQAPSPAPVKKSEPSVPRDFSATRSRLAAAVTAYLHGRYEETARLLSETKFEDRAAAAEAALFRAAAHHAKWRMGGEKDAALRARVEEDLRRFRELRPGGKPDARVFPPSFVALLERRPPAG
jgi:hypothetical protein